MADTIDEILQEFADYVAGFHKSWTIDGRFSGNLAEYQQKLHQWALDVIGEDEDLDIHHTSKELSETLWLVRKHRNNLRKEQRAKLKGDIDE